MKNKTTKATSALMVFSIWLSMCACTANENTQSTSVKKTDITSAVSVGESSFQSEPDKAVSEPSIEPIEHGEVSMIAKLDALPSYMENNTDLYTKMLSNILKLYYTGVRNGRINAENYTPVRSKDTLPSADASAEERVSAANYCTIGGALEYYSMDGDTDYYRMYNGCLPFFCNDKEGEIYLMEDVSSDSVWQVTDYEEILRYIFKYANSDELEKEAMTFVADELNNCCAEYYNGIKNGMILDTNQKQTYSQDTLPNQYTTPEPALGLAKHATLCGALDYAGKYRQFSVCIDKLGIGSDGQIHAKSDKNYSDLKSISSLNLTMGELYGG